MSQSTRLYANCVPHALSVNTAMLTASTRPTRINRFAALEYRPMFRQLMRHPDHRSPHLPGVVLLVASLAPAAHAVEAIVLEVRELTIAGMPVNDVSTRLDVLSDKQTRVTVRARSVELPAPAGRVTDITF